MTSSWQMLSIPDVWVRSLDRFEDARGENVVLYDGNVGSLDTGHTADVSPIEFVHDNMSISYHGVLRGIHTDKEAWRLMTCLIGHIQMVIVDCRASEAFGTTETLVLSDKTRKQVLVPPLVGTGFSVMSPIAAVYYKWSLPYDLARQRTYPYDDPLFQVDWPFAHPVVSERDRCGN